MLTRRTSEKPTRTGVPARTVDELSKLVAAVRAAVARHEDWRTTAELVAAALEGHLPSPDVLTAELRAGDPEGHRTHVLHTEPDGTFSILALVWRPGQVTRIHDHVTWCVFGVIQGAEHEELFALDEGGGCLLEAGSRTNRRCRRCGGRSRSPNPRCERGGCRPGEQSRSRRRFRVTDRLERAALLRAAGAACEDRRLASQVGPIPGLLRRQLGGQAEPREELGSHEGGHFLDQRPVEGEDVERRRYEPPRLVVQAV